MVDRHWNVHTLNLANTFLEHLQIHPFAVQIHMCSGHEVFREFHWFSAWVFPSLPIQLLLLCHSVAHRLPAYRGRAGCQHAFGFPGSVCRPAFGGLGELGVEISVLVFGLAVLTWFSVAIF